MEYRRGGRKGGRLTVECPAVTVGYLLSSSVFLCFRLCCLSDTHSGVRYLDGLALILCVMFPLLRSQLSTMLEVVLYSFGYCLHD